MSDFAINLSISPQTIANTDFVRILARDHLQTIVQIDLSEADLTRALQGRKCWGALHCIQPDGGEMSPAISDIEWAVCTKYRVTPAQLGGDCRARFHSNPRQILLYLLRTMTEMSLPRIGNRYNRDHTTVIAAVKAVRAKMEASPAYAAEIAEIIAAIPSGEIRLQRDREWAEKLIAGIVYWKVPAKPAPAPDPATSPYADPLARRLAMGAR
jgi:hypothetical protein